jgi:hypothetical protein
MNEMLQDTFEIVTGASEVDTIVRKRNPPRREKAGCVQWPKAGVTFSTPSYVVEKWGNDESSEAVGLMKLGDSENDSAIEEPFEMESKLRDIRPPT